MVDHAPPPVPTPPPPRYGEPPARLSADGAGPPDAGGGRQRITPDAGLARVALIILGEQPLGEVLEHVAEVTAAAVPGADEVSVTLLEGEKARTAGFSGPTAAALDERQYADGFGPCLDAARTGSVVTVPDTGDCSAYPDFAEVAVRHGVAAVLSVGMPMLGRSVGAMNVYCSSGPLAASSSDLVRVFAAYASVALTNALVVAQATDAVRQMQEAMASRAGIEQAKGVLMQSLGVSADDAFAHLSQLSQTQNRKLREVADELVRSAVRGA